MNWVQLQKKLIAAARKNPPGDQVPYAFEKRIMARLTAVPRPDPWAAMIRALWCGAGACAAVALLMSVWTYVPKSDGSSTSSFSQDLEETILASADDPDGVWW
jgi:hypothetical protein